MEHEPVNSGVEVLTGMLLGFACRVGEHQHCWHIDVYDVKISTHIHRVESVKLKHDGI